MDHEDRQGAPSAEVTTSSLKADLCRQFSSGRAKRHSAAVVNTPGAASSSMPAAELNCVEKLGERRKAMRNCNLTGLEDDGERGPSIASTLLPAVMSQLA